MFIRHRLLIAAIAIAVASTSFADPRPLRPWNDGDTYTDNQATPKIFSGGRGAWITDMSRLVNPTTTAFTESLLDDTDAAAARSTLGVDPIGTDNSTPASIVPGRDYVTLSGQAFTLNPIDLATDIIGQLPGANLSNTTVTPGSYTNADVTIDAQGRVTSAANGTAGGGSVNTSGTPVATDFARFTDGDTIEGRSPAEVLSDLGIAPGAQPDMDGAEIQAAREAVALTPGTIADGDCIEIRVGGLGGVIRGDCVSLGGLELESSGVSQTTDLKVLNITGPGVAVTEPVADEVTLTISGGGVGSGDVVGPASSVADRIATFNGTTGKVIQGGGSTIADVLASAASSSNSVIGIHSGSANAHFAHASNLAELNDQIGASLADGPHTTDTNTQLSQEQVEDFAGELIAGGTQTGITVSYDDVSGFINFVVSGGGADGNGIYDAGGSLSAATTVDTNGNVLVLGEGDLSISIAPAGDIVAISAGTGVGANDVFVEASGISLDFGSTSDLTIEGTAGEIAQRVRSGGNNVPPTWADVIREKDIVIENATDDQDPMIYARADIVPNALHCVATGAVAPVSHVVTVMECDANGTAASCSSTGLTASLSTSETTVSDTTPTDSLIAAGNWWGLHNTSIGTAAERLNCTVVFTERG